MSVVMVIDPLPTLDPEVDASIGLAAALLDLGRDVWVCTPEDLSVHAGRVRARARTLTLAPRRRGTDHRWQVEAVWHRLGPTRVLDVAGESELVLLRIDPPVDDRYLRTTYLLDLVELAGTRVVNRPEGVRALHEKVTAMRFTSLAPTTTVTADPREVRRFVAGAGTAVLKPFDGFGGQGVWLLRDDDACLPLAESATHGGRRHVILQPYLPEVADGNKRLFVLDGDIIGAVMRCPSAEDFRIGAPVSRAEVDDVDREHIRALAPLLARHGVALAGVDVIGGLLIEVNITCPGGMHKTDALLGTDLSSLIARRLLGLPDESVPSATAPEGRRHHHPLRDHPTTEEVPA